MSIQNIMIGCYGEEPPREITAPPERLVDLAVISGVAHFTLRDGEDPTAEPLFTFEVPAESMRLALETAIKDDVAEIPAG